jgi:hypothetical protein
LKKANWGGRQPLQNLQQLTCTAILVSAGCQMTTT